MYLLSLLHPWEPSPTTVIAFALAAALFLRGQLRRPVGALRGIAFWSGLILLYGCLHTKMDYYAEHEFFVHRIQHLILHHLGPLLIMGAIPGPVMRAALPLRWRGVLYRGVRTAPARFVAALFHPSVITILFILSVLVWLIPSVQFVAMLDWRIYRFMNWSVTATGLLYWWMVLDRRPAPPAWLAPGMRVLSPVITMTPQILVGAIITFSTQDLYPIFDLCGRAFGLPMLVDQSVGGLIMWIPAALIEAVGGLIALRIWMRLSEKGRLPQRKRRGAVPAATTAPATRARPNSP